MPFPGATIRCAMSDSSFFCSAVSAGCWCVMVAVAASGRGLSHAPAGRHPETAQSPFPGEPGPPRGWQPDPTGQDTLCKPRGRDRGGCRAAPSHFAASQPAPSPAILRERSSAGTHAGHEGTGMGVPWGWEYPARNGNSPGMGVPGGRKYSGKRGKRNPRETQPESGVTRTLGYPGDGDTP